MPPQKTFYQKRIDKAQNELELNSIFLEFMKVYVQLYSDTDNKEYWEMAKFIAQKRLEIIEKLDLDLSTV